MIGVFLLGFIYLFADYYLGLYEQCFAGFYALAPRVVKFGATSISTVPEPRTTVTAATSFPGFCDGAASKAFCTDAGRSCEMVYLGEH